MPSYTVAQCEDEIAAIDAELKKLRGVATDFSIDKKRFNFAGKRKELLAEREEWLGRLTVLQGGNPFQGPRLFEA